MRAVLVIGAAIVLVGCVSSDAAPATIYVGDNTRQIEGRLSETGQWTLFPTRSIRNYNPFSEVEAQKCVSLVDADGVLQADPQAREGRWVTLTGMAVKYEDLIVGESASDQLMNKRYYDGVVVENACLRPFVFVVEGVTR